MCLCISYGDEVVGVGVLVRRWYVCYFSRSTRTSPIQTDINSDQKHTAHSKPNPKSLI